MIAENTSYFILFDFFHLNLEVRLTPYIIKVQRELIGAQPREVKHVLINSSSFASVLETELKVGRRCRSFCMIKTQPTRHATQAFMQDTSSRCTPTFVPTHTAYLQHSTEAEYGEITGIGLKNTSDHKVRAFIEQKNMLKAYLFYILDLLLAPLLN